MIVPPMLLRRQEPPFLTRSPAPYWGGEQEERPEPP